jgi:type II secretory pathway pseudopilin PulG
VLRRRHSGPRGAVRNEPGFTLVELVVAMALGIVVMIAAFTVLIVTLHQTTRTFTRVDATQRARTKLAWLETLLQSACVTSGVTPIQPGSTSTTLVFVSAFGKDPQPTPVEHQVSFSAATGKLTDAQYAVTGGSAPNWTFASTPSTTITLLTAVTQSGTTPPFQYFAYQEVPNGGGGYYSDGAGDPYMMLLDGTASVPGTNPPVIPAANPLAATPPAGLSTANADSAAEVLVTLRVGAPGSSLENTTLSDGPLTVTDSIGLRLTPPPNNISSGASFGPCT